ncbi:MAG: Rrf2 family transcriptional regulator [bacterium]|jgi:Rrf2 family protein
MLLSKSCVYAIRAALLVTSRTNKRTRDFIPLQEIAAELNLSFHFLTKILQQLTQAKIMESFRGPRGGVLLAKPASSVYLIDIIKVVDGMGAFENCVLGLPDCSEKAPCPLHREWKKRRQELRKMFERYTLTDLARGKRVLNLKN